MIRGLLCIVSLWSAQGFYSIPRGPHRPSTTSLLASSTDTLEDIARRYKIVSYGQGPNSFYGVECTDRLAYIKDITVPIRMAGGLGLELSEAYLRDETSGLVLIENIVPGSNAAQTNLIQPGDLLLSIASTQESSYTSLEGLNFDQTINILRRYSSEQDVTLKVNTTMHS